MQTLTVIGDTSFCDDEDTGPWQAIDGLSSDNAIGNILLLHSPGAGTHTYSARAKMSGSSKNFDVSEGGLLRQLSATRVGTNWNQARYSFAELQHGDNVLCLTCCTAVVLLLL